MFSSFALPFKGWNKSFGTQAIDISPVKVHDAELGKEKSARALKHLINANHINHSIIYNHLRFHNHTPHILGSAYILGASPDQLNKIYEAESRTLEPWRDSPGEISRGDWRDFLGKKEYQRAFIDFFEDQLVTFGYDWKKLLEHYMFEGKQPLINSIVSGLAHPVIHLGYSYELNSRNVAIEALGLAACFYDDLHKFCDDPSYTRPSSYTSKDPLEILQKVSRDERFDKLKGHNEPADIHYVLEKCEEAVLDHWNAWKIDEDPKKQFELSQRAAVALLVATNDGSQSYDFFILHTLTSSHAVRILLPLVPPQFQIPVVRQWWLFTLLAYISQQRPSIDLDRINKHDLKGKTWKNAKHLALTSQFMDDAHYVKGIRSMGNMAETWGDEESFYLKAAVRFSEGFDGWGGFAGMY